MNKYCTSQVGEKICKLNKKIIKFFKMWTIDPGGLWHWIQCYHGFIGKSRIFYPLSQDVIKPNHLIKIDLSIHTVDLCIRKYKLPTSRQDKLLFFNILKYIFSALIRQEHLF